MRWMILFLLLSLNTKSFGQKFLQIEKYGKTKVIKFYVGDELTYQIKGDKKTWYEGTINDLIVDENLIVFENRVVKMKDITAIRTFKHAKLSRSLSFQLPRFCSGIWRIYIAGYRSWMVGNNDFCDCRSWCCGCGGIVGPTSF